MSKPKTTKVRVIDLAEMLDKSNPEMLDILKELGIEVKTVRSSITQDEALRVEEFLKDKESAKEEEAAKTVAAMPVTKIAPGSSVADIAKEIGETPGNAVKILMGAGIMMPATTAADEKVLDLLSKGFGKHFVFGTPDAKPKPAASDAAPQAKAEQPKQEEKKKTAKLESKKAKSKNAEAGEGKLIPRPPIITVMGHVDHGKTTLLDTIRNTRVTEKEFGGITQHIGASRVEYDGHTLVFLDTPGHEAFTSMRARGAQVTDIAILVVAADDGLMPQSIEAMNHAKAAGVPIVVAINKMDKPDAKPDRVRQQLSDHGLVPEEWGGDTIMVEVAAKPGTNVDQLLEMVILVAEMLELTADPSAKPEGTVIEANLDKGKGPVATVIVQNGTLRKGSIIHTETAWGKIRAMIDDTGKFVDSAGPSMPVEILGLENVPQPGDLFATVASEREARDLMSDNEAARRELDQTKAKRLTLEELYEKMQTEEVPQLRIVLKTDVQGSLEAFHASLMKMSVDAVQINIVHEGVGRISESDVMLASASNAIIIGFNVRPDNNAKKTADNEGVQIRLYQVIYDMLDDVKAAMEGMLAPELRENTLGMAEIREIFRVPKIGNIAGCRVTEGLIRRSAKVRLIREGVVFWNGELSSLKHFKDDVREVKAPNECGLSFEKFQDFRIGDMIEAYEILKEKKTLD
ncbi:translation initiation factor IF-2 [Synergistaceae bacterium OttesenSCG-928-D05]|nr:translation initiation factor IF-2 [Synergistaceae bacterium OttesenSCG-928-D05]